MSSFLPFDLQMEIRLQLESKTPFETAVYQGKACLLCSSKKAPSSCVGEIRIGKYRTFRIYKKAHLIGDIDASDGSETRTLQMVTDFLVQELDKVRNAGDSEVTVLLRNSNESVPTPSTQVKDIPCKGYKLVDKKNQPCTEKTDNLLIWQSKKGQLVSFCRPPHLFRYLQAKASRGDSGKQKRKGTGTKQKANDKPEENKDGR